MKIPDAMTFLCFMKGLPVCGVFAVLKLETHHKNSLDLIIGPSGVDGEIIVTRPQIEEDISSEISLFPMDYSGLSDITGKATVTPLDVEAYERALMAYEAFKSAFSFPDDYSDNLQSAKHLLETSAPTRLSIAEIDCVGTRDLAVSTMSVDID